MPQVLPLWTRRRRRTPVHRPRPQAICRRRSAIRSSRVARRPARRTRRPSICWPCIPGSPESTAPLGAFAAAINARLMARKRTADDATRATSGLSQGVGVSFRRRVSRPSGGVSCPRSGRSCSRKAERRPPIGHARVPELTAVRWNAIIGRAGWLATPARRIDENPGCLHARAHHWCTCVERDRRPRAHDARPGCLRSPPSPHEQQALNRTGFCGDSVS
jgi:hypothetical protein